MPFKYSAYAFICLLASFLFRALQIFSDSRFGCTLTTSTQRLKKCFLLLLFFIIVFFPTFFSLWDSLRIRIILDYCASIAQTLLFSVSGFGCYRSEGPAMKLVCPKSQVPHSPTGSTTKDGGGAWFPSGQDITVWSPLALSRTPRQESALEEYVKCYCIES